MSPALHQPATDHDVIVIGGALSGAAGAMLLLRGNPGLRVLIVEKSAKFDRKVGEATVEVSGYFLGRTLGLTQYLNENHLCKQGLRFWFSNDKVRSLDEASEIGPRYLARLPSYQIDRAELDEEVLRRAVRSGAVLLRPAAVAGVRLNPGGMQEVEVKQDGERRVFRGRWVLDASGIAALLARKEGWMMPNPDHQTTSAWARWKGVKDWDGRELMEKYPKWAAAHFGTRGTATNHIIGDGWWSWWIPLKGGDVSVGVVFDQRLVDFPEGANIGERLRTFLNRHPAARELLEHAEYQSDDLHWRKNLAYQSDRFAGDGFVLAGDAAAFMDPFYSPGMDWIAFSVVRGVDTITRHLAGGDAASLAERQNQDLALCLSRWFDALYRDKYHYLGDYSLMKLAFLLDLSLYYWGVVRAVFEEEEEGFLTAPFTHPAAGPIAALMRIYNHRLAVIAARRRRIGTFGRMNDRHRMLISGFLISPGEIRRVIPPLLGWLKLELTEGWHTWGKTAEVPGERARR